jgi:hypothetical protein
MPRRKRRDKATEGEIENLERQFWELRRSIDHVRYRLTPFRSHDDALGALVLQLHRTMNVLHDRDPDYERPHLGHGHGIPSPGR